MDVGTLVYLSTIIQSNFEASPARVRLTCWQSQGSEVSHRREVARRAGADLVAFIRQYPGRMDSMLLTDGPADASRHAPLFGKGDTPWKEILSSAETTGGVRFYLLNHGSTGWPPLEAARRDLEQYKQFRAQMSSNIPIR